MVPQPLWHLCWLGPGKSRCCDVGVSIMKERKQPLCGCYVGQRRLSVEGRDCWRAPGSTSECLHHSSATQSAPPALVEMPPSWATPPGALYMTFKLALFFRALNPLGPLWKHGGPYSHSFFAFLLLSTDGAENNRRAEGGWKGECFSLLLSLWCNQTRELLRVSDYAITLSFLTFHYTFSFQKRLLLYNFIFTSAENDTWCFERFVSVIVDGSHRGSFLPLHHTTTACQGSHPSLQLWLMYTQQVMLAPWPSLMHSLWLSLWIKRIIILW